MELCELTNPRCKKSVRFNLSYIIASIALQIDHEVELQWNADKKMASLVREQSTADRWSLLKFAQPRIAVG